MSKSLFLKMSALTLVVVVMIVASLVAGDLLVRTFAAPQGVIVQLQRDPVIVAKAAAEARGQNFDPAEYRQQIIAEQNAFLDQLSAAGIDYSLVSVAARTERVAHLHLRRVAIEPQTVLTKWAVATAPG